MNPPVAEYDALIADLRRRAANAARRNKPTMWAYYLDTAQGLEDWFADVDRNDGAYAGAALALSESAERACPNLEPLAAARLWARGVYARRILATWGAGTGSRVSLRWLRERVA